MSSDPDLKIPYYDYRVAVYSNLIKGIVYGAYIVVYVCSVYAILSKPDFTSSRPRMFMFGITTFMFALGIITLVLGTTLDFQIETSADDDTDSAACYYAWATITCLMYILCDIVCAWRTVVLWNNDKRVIGILGLSIIVTIGTAGVALALSLPEGPDSGETDISFGWTALIVVGPILVTNLLSTGLIAWKAWQRRITVKEHLSEGRGPLRVGRVFALLIESGLIYCCVWILYWISQYTTLFNPGFSVVALVSGLYPTLIIFLVSMQMSPVELYSTHSTETHYTRVPARGLSMDGDVPQHLLTIRCHSTSDTDTLSSTVLGNPSEEEKNVLPPALV